MYVSFSDDEDMRGVSINVQPGLTSNLQYFFTLSFEDRKEIEQHDYEMIQALDLSYYGKKAWPLFRSIQPGHLPWYLDETEIPMFIHLLRAVLIACERYQENPKSFNMKDNDIYALIEDELGMGWDEKALFQNIF